MSRIFYEMEQAALALSISVEELEEMCSTEELRVVRIGERRRLVRVADVEALLERVRSGYRLRTRREFRGPTVEKAVAQAASTLRVAPDLLSYRVLKAGSAWAPDADGNGVRIVVEVPEEEPETADTADGGTAEAGTRGAEEMGAYYYAPGQVARLLGTDVHEVNLRIYLKELPAVNINDYCWVPRDAVNERLSRAPAPKLEDPPKPFFIVTPEEPESAEYSRLGAREIVAGEPLPSPELLKRKLAGMEEEVRTLREELRVEKLRNLRQPQGDPATSAEGTVERLSRRTGLMPGPAENPE